GRGHPRPGRAAKDEPAHHRPIELLERLPIAVPRERLLAEAPGRGVPAHAPAQLLDVQGTMAAEGRLDCGICYLHVAPSRRAIYTDPGAGNPLASSSSTRTQSLSRPTVGGTNARDDPRGKRPAGWAVPVRGSNQEAAIVRPDSRARATVKGWPDAL